MTTATWQVSNKGPMSRDAVYASMGLSPPVAKLAISLTDSEEEGVTVQPTPSSASSAVVRTYFCGETCKLVRLSANGKQFATMRPGPDGFLQAQWSAGGSWDDTEIANLQLVAPPPTVMKRPAAQMKKPAASTAKEEEEEKEEETLESIRSSDAEEEEEADEVQFEDEEAEKTPAKTPAKSVPQKTASKPPGPLVLAWPEGDMIFTGNQLRLVKATGQTYILGKVDDKWKLVVSVHSRYSNHLDVVVKILSRLEQMAEFGKTVALKMRREILGF